MKPKITSEYDIHCAVADWIRWNEEAHPLLKMAWHTPNGGQRHKAIAAKLKRMLVRPGVPDFILPVPQQNWMGLAIEMKGLGGRATKEQASMLARLSMFGWKCHVCNSADEAIKLFSDYIGL